MGLSETIIAAIIGAGATMATAIVQLIRNRTPSDVRPKKKRLRSLFATIALMIGCIVGGYAWSSLRAVSANDEMRSTLQTEFSRQFAALEAHQPDRSVPTAGTSPDGGSLPVSHISSSGAESLVQLPPCRVSERTDEASGATCSEHAAQTVALCAALPTAAQSTRLQVMVRTLKPDSPWQTRDANSPTIGDLHVSEAQSEPLPGVAEHPVCLSVANWSVTDSLMVRLLVDYTLPPVTPTVPVAAPITAALQ